MAPPSKRSRRTNFRQFFFRGLAILLPTVLTIWLLIAAYQFVDTKIAEPINVGVRRLVILATPWPTATAKDLMYAEENLTADQQAEWRALVREQSLKLADRWSPRAEAALREQWLRPKARAHAIERWWDSVSVGSWSVMDLIGLAIAVVLIYFVGAILGSFIGRRLYARGEQLLEKVPLIRRVYPSIKQVTDFFVGDRKQAVQFNRVVAVQYPRKGIWSMGLVTGDGMRTIEDSAGVPCATVFVPSSPTPFTGYVITVPKADTIDLNVSIEQAVRFTISGGVITPPGEQITYSPAGRMTARSEDEPA